MRASSWRWWMLGLAALCGASGCVERRMVIITDPPSAIVYDEKFQPIGAGPVDKPFTYYGTYGFRVVKDGYETLDVSQRVRMPWYEFPGLDFFSENVIPWTIRDVRIYHYVLQRADVRQDNPQTVLDKGEVLRGYSKTLGIPGLDVTPPSDAPPTVLGPPTPDS